MGEVVREMQADGRLGERFHIVTHSTGALVVRQWLALFHPEGGARRWIIFLMLAPANFGSPLAVMGRSALGRLIKGCAQPLPDRHGVPARARNTAPMAQENLALADRLSRSGETTSPFSEASVRPYVITGLDVFRPMGILNESAWDGTVRAASANLDPQGVTVDFTASSETGGPERRFWTRRGPEAVPFAVLPDRHHLNITEPLTGGPSGASADAARRLGRLVLQALQVTSANEYRTLRSNWIALNDATRTLVQPEKGSRTRGTGRGGSALA